MSPAEEGVSDVVAKSSKAGAAVSKKGRKRRKTAVADGSVTADEMLRRKRQAELRTIAMRLRDSGQVYSSYRQRKQKYRNTDGSGATTVDKVEEKKAAAVAAAAAAARGDGDEEGERSSKKARVQTKQEPGAPGEAPAKQLSKNYKGDKEPGWRPFNEVQVIVLPIFWNMHKEEKAGVMEAAEKVQAVLREGGISVDTDSSNKYTPGQKMKYWETMGVGVRIELGPKDAEAGRAVLALAGGVPGTVAQKSTFKVGPELLAAVTSALAAARGQGGGSRGAMGGALNGGDDAAKEEDDERRKAKKDKKKEAKDKKRRLTLAGRDGTVMMRGSNAAEPGGDDEDGEGGDEDGEGDEEQAGEEWGGEEGEGAEVGMGEEEGQEEEYEEEEAPHTSSSTTQQVPHSSSGSGSAAHGKQQPKVAMGGGDDLEDDFDIDVDEPEEDKLTLSKDERKQKSRKVQKLRHKKDKLEARGGLPTSRSAGDAEPDEQDAAPERRKKKDASNRVVTF